MPKDKTASHIRIVEAMKAEFLEKGFSDASIRSIGQRAGLTSAALYRHYSSKEAMFCAVVEPLVQEIQQRMKYENYIHDFVEANQGDLANAIDWMKAQGYPAIHLEQEELHMLLSAYITAIIEPIIHGYPDEKITAYLDRMSDFFMPGWMKMMGLSPQESQM